MPPIIDEGYYSTDTAKFLIAIKILYGAFSNHEKVNSYSIRSLDEYVHLVSKCYSIFNDFYIYNFGYVKTIYGVQLFISSTITKSNDIIL